MSNTIEIKITDPRASAAPPPPTDSGGIHVTPGAWERMQQVGPKSEAAQSRYASPDVHTSAPTAQTSQTPGQQSADKTYWEEQQRAAERDARRKEREERANQKAQERAAEARMSYEERIDRDAKRQEERDARRKDVADRRNQLNPPTVSVATPVEVDQVKSGKTAKPRGAEAKEKHEKDMGKLGQVAGGAGVEDANMIASAATGNPVAIAMLAIKAKEKFEKQMGDIVRAPADIAEGVAKPVESMARGNNAQAAFEAAEGMNDLVKKIPLVGEGLGLVNDTALRLGHAFTDVANAFIERGREISGYSGETAASYAISDVRQLMADIKESQTLGPQFARLNDAQTDLSIMLRDFLLPVKEVIMNRIATVLENIERWAKDNMDELVTMRTILIHTPEAIAVAMGPLGIVFLPAEIVKIKQAIADAIRESHEDAGALGDKDWMDAVERKLHPPGGIPIQVQGGIRGPDPRIHFPIIGGA